MKKSIAYLADLFLLWLEPPNLGQFQAIYELFHVPFFAGKHQLDHLTNLQAPYHLL
ncbi:hypothetical protein D3C73_1650150 [compost metagenome]